MSRCQSGTENRPKLHMNGWDVCKIAVMLGPFGFWGCCCSLVGTVQIHFKGYVGETSERWGGALMGFSECIHTVLN